MLRQHVPLAAFRVDRPSAEARLAVGHALGCTVVAGLVALAITCWPLPLYPGAGFGHDAWYVVLFKLGWMLAVPVVYLAIRGYGARMGSARGGTVAACPGSPWCSSSRSSLVTTEAR